MSRVLIETVPLDRVREMFETNVLGAMRMVQAVAPSMRERGSGTIVNLSSVAGRTCTALNGPYAASKHAIEAISEALRYELGHFGVRVVLVEPGYTATAWSRNEQWLGVDKPPWDTLYEQVRQRDLASQGDASPAELVAGIIAEAIESDDPPLRWPAGPDAELTLAVRSDVDDAEWERLVRETTGLDW